MLVKHVTRAYAPLILCLKIVFLFLKNKNKKMRERGEMSKNRFGNNPS